MKATGSERFKMLPLKIDTFFLPLLLLNCFFYAGQDRSDEAGYQEKRKPLNSGENKVEPIRHHLEGINSADSLDQSSKRTAAVIVVKSNSVLLFWK